MAKKPPETSESVKLMTVKQASALDGSSEKTTRRAIKAGLLEVLRLGPGGRMIRITPEAHDAYRRRRRG